MQQVLGRNALCAMVLGLDKEMQSNSIGWHAIDTGWSRSKRDCLYLSESDSHHGGLFRSAECHCIDHCTPSYWLDKFRDSWHADKIQLDVIYLAGSLTQSYPKGFEEMTSTKVITLFDCNGHTLCETQLPFDWRVGDPVGGE